MVLATSNSNEAMMQAVDALRPDGRLVVMGVDGSTPFSFLPATALNRRIRIITSSQNNRRDLFEALAYVAEGKVKVMTETFALDDNRARVRPGRERRRSLPGRSAPERLTTLAALASRKLKRVRESDATSGSTELQLRRWLFSWSRRKRYTAQERSMLESGTDREPGREVGAPSPSRPG